MKAEDQLLSILVPRDCKGSKNFPSKTVLFVLSIDTFATGRMFWAKKQPMERPEVQVWGYSCVDLSLPLGSWFGMKETDEEWEQKERTAVTQIL